MRFYAATSSVTDLTGGGGVTFSDQALPDRASRISRAFLEFCTNCIRPRDM